MMSNENTVRLIAIAGGSCAGKSTLAAALSEALRAAPVIGMDAYYHDLSQVPEGLRHRHNFDDPAALDAALLLGQLAQILRGETVRVPEYDYRHHVRSGFRSVEPRDYVILDGLHALYWENIRRLAALCVFVELDHAVCLQRRIRRDGEQRGRTEASVRAQYAGTVQPMYDTHVAPARGHAGLVIRGDAPVAESVTAILSRLPGPGGDE